tara:strand:- start:36 stop:3209 length:3174 start_codon:yes stop_codon:yes gene_type:complete
MAGQTNSSSELDPIEAEGGLETISPETISLGESVSGRDPELDAIEAEGGLESISPGGGDIVVPAVQSAIGSAMDLGGGVAGLKAGVALTAPIPILGARVAGGAIGFLAGVLGGHKLREVASEFNFPGTDIPVTYPDLESFPEDQRLPAIAGEVFGGGGVIGASTIRLARSGWRMAAPEAGSFLPKTRSFVSNLLNRILTTAEKHTGTFVVGEVGGMTGASIGGMAAETAAPGSTGVRISGEIAGGFLNPLRIASSFGKKVVAVWSDAFFKVTSAGQETRAARILQDFIEEAGEDPVLLARLLDDAGLPDLGPQTAAQKTGSPALAVIEARLAEMSGSFSVEAKQLYEANLRNIDAMIKTLRGTSDPGALKVAAELKRIKFQQTLALLVANAEENVQKAAARIAGDTPGARSSISEKAHKALGGALEEARKVESEFWAAIDDTVRVNPDDIIKEYEQLLREMLPDEKLPSVIRNFVKRLSKEGKRLKKEGADPTVSMGEVILLRKRALALAREALANNKFSDARAYGHIAESVLDALDTTFARQADGAVKEAYDTARTFSRELNDTFTRTFAGTALQKGPTGASRVPPELMLDRALATGAQARDMRLRELEEATRFLSRPEFADVADTGQILDIMIHAQEDVIRLAAADMIDPITHLPSAPRLAKFIKDNAELLKRFPNIKKDLKAAVKSSQKLKDVQRIVDGGSRVADKKAAFSAAAKVENSVHAVTSAVKGKNPVRELKALAKLAHTSAEALEGMRASIFDHAMGEATIGGRLDYKALRRALFDPINPGQPSLVDIMESSLVLDGPSVKRITRLLDEADKVTAVATVSSRGAEDILGEADMFVDLITRAAGSTAATFLSKKAGMSGAGPSLVIAQAGSRVARRLMDKVPRGRVRDVLIEAAMSNEFMAMLLRKPLTTAQKMEWSRQVHAYALQAGFFASRDVETNEAAAAELADSNIPSPAYMPGEGGVGEGDALGAWSEDVFVPSEEVNRRNLESAKRTYSDYVDSLPFANTPGNQAAFAHAQFVLNDEKAKELRADIEYWRKQHASSPEEQVAP